MDRLIKRFDAERDFELMFCAHRGVAYQRDMSVGRIRYDDTYFDHYKKLDGTPIAKKLNDARCEMVARHAPAGAKVFDFGSGSGTFVRHSRLCGFNTFGFDVMPKSVSFLNEINAYCDTPEEFDVVTFWDSLEHIENPEEVFNDIRRQSTVFVALPIFKDVVGATVRASKHHKPGEHLYYWTRDGFVSWMAMYGFRLLEESDHEIQAGRESIGAFAFLRDLPDYQDHIELYKKMHVERFYGSSATELHLDSVASVIRDVKPMSILDYGCGRSDLVAHFWLDGAREIVRHDPAIREFRHLPEHGFDIVLCCDVLEHIPLDSIDMVLIGIRKKSHLAFFTISTKLARAKLPDGRNAHVTLLTHNEWTRWIKEYFGSVKVLPATSQHELILLAGPTKLSAPQ